MKIVLQKVQKAFVDVDDKTIAEIQEGYVLLLGVHKDDTKEQADKLVEKVCKLKLFAQPGSETFMEQNILEAQGSVLVVSQFTLFGNTKKGSKPSFSDAARPELAKELYAYFVDQLQERGVPTQIGAFGEHMEVMLVNDGPITLVLEA